MAGPKFSIGEIADVYLKRNFEALSRWFRDNHHLEGFKFYEITFTNDQQNFKFAHGLPTAPRDIITTSITGPGVLTWNYDLFDSSMLDISTTDACVVRFFVGNYVNG